MSSGSVCRAAGHKPLLSVKGWDGTREAEAAQGAVLVGAAVLYIRAGCRGCALAGLLVCIRGLQPPLQVSLSAGRHHSCSKV